MLEKSKRLRKLVGERATEQNLEFCTRYLDLFELNLLVEEGLSAQDHRIVLRGDLAVIFDKNIFNILAENHLKSEYSKLVIELKFERKGKQVEELH